MILSLIVAEVVAAAGAGAGADGAIVAAAPAGSGAGRRASPVWHCDGPDLWYSRFGWAGSGLSVIGHGSESSPVPCAPPPMNMSALVCYSYYSFL